MKNAVVISCNDKYVPYAIVSLSKFIEKNQAYEAYVISSYLSPESYELLSRYNIKSHVIDLYSSFPNLHKRPYGTGYPIECFYHFYAYKLLDSYDYIVSIEADMYTQKSLSYDLTKINYIGGVIDGNLISDFYPIMNDLNKIKTAYPDLNINQERIRGGLKIYNVKNLLNISFFETIVSIYKRSWEINAPRCGDDSLMVLYQMIYPDHFTFLPKEYNIIGSFIDVNSVYIYHELESIKWWMKNNNSSKTSIHFKEAYRNYLNIHFDESFIKKYIQ